MFDSNYSNDSHTIYYVIQSSIAQLWELRTVVPYYCITVVAPKNTNHNKSIDNNPEYFVTQQLPRRYLST